jgi:tetratricopeptide (TPR) repeat protein
MLPGEQQDAESFVPKSSSPPRTSEAMEETLEREERWEELAARLVERAEAAAGGERIANLRRAAQLFETRLAEPDKALLVLQAAFREDLESEEVARELARLTTQLDRWPASIEEWEALFFELPAREQQLSLLIAVARFHEQDLKDFEAAQRNLDRATELAPNHPRVLQAVSALASAQGDWSRAADSLTSAARAEGNAVARVRLHLAAGALLEERLGETARASEQYRAALAVDPGNAAAKASLARVSPEAAPPAQPFQPAPSAMVRVEDLAPASNGSAPAAASAADVVALAEAAWDAFQDKRWNEAKVLGQRALGRPGLPAEDRAGLAECVGRACLALDDVEAAVRSLLPAVEATPDDRGCRETLMEAYYRAGDDGGVTQQRQALLGLCESDQERSDLLVAAARKQRDERRDQASALKLFNQALAFLPDDQGTLHEILELHTNAKDWKAAVSILEKLAHLETGRDRARYQVAAANILNYQLHSLDDAVELYNQALDEDPDDLKSFERIERILTSKRDWREEARNYRRMIKRLGPTPGADKRPVALLLWKGLGECLRSRLKDLPAAATAFEVCATLEPEDLGFQEILAEIYERIGPEEQARAMDKRKVLLAAARGPAEMAAQIRALLRVFRERQQVDRVYCACAALVALGAAETKEQDFYQRAGGRPPPVAVGGLSEEMWQRAVYHLRQDRRLSQLFATVSPSVALVRAKDVRGWGLEEKRRVQPDSPLGQILTLASALLGVAPPPLFVFPDREGQLDVANVVVDKRVVPTLVAGGELSRPRAQPELSFLVGRALALLRFDHLVLWPQVVASQAELRVVIQAAIKMFQPERNIPSADPAALKQYLTVLQKTLPPQALEPLMAVVPVLADGVDLELWMATALMTANRAGLLVCGDVVSATRVLLEQGGGGLPPEDAVADLVRWSVSPEHLALREQLGLALQTRS